MWGGSDRLFDCLTKNHHNIRTKVEILVDGQVEKVLYGKTVIDPVRKSKAAWYDGKVSVTPNQVRRESDLSIVDLSEIPGDLSVSDAEDLFAPLRSEFRVWRGYQYYNATEGEILSGQANEYWPCGTFIINKASMKWPQIALHGYDRLWNLRGRFQSPWVVRSGTPNMVELEKLLRANIPGPQANIELPISDAVSPALIWEEQDDKLQRANDLVLADGKILYADPMGTIRAADAPLPAQDFVVWTFTPGRFNIAQTPERDIDATDAENVVVATGETNGDVPPVKGIVKDTNPASFTYIGKTAEVPRFYSSPLLTTQLQCVKAAQTILMKELGIADSIVVPSIPIPALEWGDVIQVVDSKIQADDLLLVDSFDIPLRASGTTTINCRTQRIQVGDA
jgi:hypothetical protein